jgi:hypothetical protein
MTWNRFAHAVVCGAHLGRLLDWVTRIRFMCVVHRLNLLGPLSDLVTWIRFACVVPQLLDQVTWIWSVDRVPILTCSPCTNPFGPIIESSDSDPTRLYSVYTEKGRQTWSLGGAWMRVQCKFVLILAALWDWIPKFWFVYWSIRKNTWNAEIQKGSGWTIMCNCNTLK